MTTTLLSVSLGFSSWKSWYKADPDIHGRWIWTPQSFMNCLIWFASWHWHHSKIDEVTRNGYFPIKGLCFADEVEVTHSLLRKRILMLQSAGLAVDKSHSSLIMWTHTEHIHWLPLRYAWRCKKTSQNDCHENAWGRKDNGGGTIAVEDGDDGEGGEGEGCWEVAVAEVAAPAAAGVHQLGQAAESARQRQVPSGCQGHLSR